MNHYKNTQIVSSKPSIYGGRKFIKWNTETKFYYIGNTASTAVSTSAPIYIYGTTMKEISEVERQLKNLGYTEYVNNWSADNDTYGDIAKAGL